MASCEEEGTEFIELGTKDPVVAITDISPSYGYVGDEFDVIGENFASAVDFVKVRIGENMAKVLTCTDESNYRTNTGRCYYWKNIGRIL